MTSEIREVSRKLHMSTAAKETIHPITTALRRFETHVLRRAVDRISSEQ
jgi:hypothetical protein